MRPELAAGRDAAETMATELSAAARGCSNPGAFWAGALTRLTACAAAQVGVAEIERLLEMLREIIGPTAQEVVDDLVDEVISGKSQGTRH